MKKYIGFNLGQYGDLVMNTVAAKALKLRDPDSFLVLGLGPQYADMEPLFRHHKDFDAIHVYDSYEEWPNKKDAGYLEKCKYDHVFDGMPQHTCSDWYKKYHQCLEVCLMHGLDDPRDYSCELTKWFDNSLEFDKNFIAFAPFAGSYNNNSPKKLSIDKAQEIVNLCHKLNYSVLQLGGPYEPKLMGTFMMDTDYFNSVKNMLSCKMLIHTDTGLGWVASAYEFPCLGLYMNNYYDGCNVKNIQPINPNAVYLTEDNLNNISLDTIKEKIQLLE